MLFTWSLVAIVVSCMQPQTYFGDSQNINLSEGCPKFSITALKVDSDFEPCSTIFPRLQGLANVISPDVHMVSNDTSIPIKAQVKDEVKAGFLAIPQEVAEYMLGFLSVVELARAASVSNLWHWLVCNVFNRKFKSPDANGKLVFSFSKLYHEFWRIKNYITPKETLALKLYLENLLLDQKMSTELSAKAYQHNQQIQFFITELLRMSDMPTDLKSAQAYIDAPLMNLVFKYKKLEGKLSLVTPSCIKNFGANVFKGKVNMQGVNFFFGSNVFEEDHATRKQLFSLFKNASASLKVLVEKEDLFDTNILSSEIGIAEFCYLDALVIDEKSCARALDLSRQFMEQTSSSVFIFLISKTLRSPLFISKILRFIKQRGHDIAQYIFHLTDRKDNEAVYRLLYNVDEIIQSIKFNTDQYTPMEKIACGLMIGLEDQVLMPIITDAEYLENVAELVWISIKKKRSINITRTLKSRTLGSLEIIVNQGDLGRRERSLCFIQTVPLDCTPAEIDTYCQMLIGSHSLWFRCLTDSSFLAYAHHRLDTDLELKNDSWAALLRIADEAMIKKLIRFTMKTGRMHMHLPKFFSLQLEYIMRDYIHELFTEGIFPYNLFRVEEGEILELSYFRTVVLKELLWRKNVFAKLLAGEKDAEGFIDFKNKQTRIVAGTMVTFAVVKVMDMDIEVFHENQDFKDLVFVSILGLLTKKHFLNINLDDYPMESRSEAIEKIFRQHPKTWRKFTRCMNTTFNDGTDGSDFRKFLLSVIVDSGLSALLPEKMPCPLISQ